MEPRILCALLAALALAPLNVAHAFDASPALPDTDGQHTPPAQFSAIDKPAWAISAPALPESTRELIAACKDGNTASVKAALAAGAVPNRADERGQRPLLIAVAAGHGEFVRLLLHGGASPNVKGPQGLTPLGIAAAAGDLRIVRLLLSAGADVDARSDNQSTALHQAVRFDHPEVVRALLAASPDPKRFDREGLHPLALAAAEGRLACLAYLLDSGIAPDLPDRTGHTALYWARLNDELLAVNLLVERGAARESSKDQSN